MKKKTKFATRHLLPYPVKKNSSLRCIEIRWKKKESTRFKGYFLNASSNKGNYPCGVGSPPTLSVFPLAFLSSTRPNENKDAMLPEGIP